MRTVCLFDEVYEILRWNKIPEGCPPLKDFDGDKIKDAYKKQIEQE